VFCPHCGARKISDQDLYCGSCGKPMLSAPPVARSQGYGGPVAPGAFPQPYPASRPRSWAWRFFVFFFYSLFLLVVATAKVWAPLLGELLQSMGFQLPR